MKIITSIVIAQLFLIISGTEVPREQRRVGCIYLGFASKPYGVFQPEDIDASICTHIKFDIGGINEETEEIEIRAQDLQRESNDEDLISRFAKLKESNPDVKLILHVSPPRFEWIFSSTSRRSNIIRNGVKWINESGFHGLDFRYRDAAPDTEDTADFFCDMKSEFDKYGYTLSVTLMDNLLPGPSQEQRESFNKFASCLDHMAFDSFLDDDKAYRILGLKNTKSKMDMFIEKGLPANKIVMAVPAVGIIFTLENPDETGLDVKIGNDSFRLMGGEGAYHKDIMKEINNSSLGWTFRREEETQEPYAFSNTGLWISYEDKTSMEFKANTQMTCSIRI